MGSALGMECKFGVALGWHWRMDGYDTHPLTQLSSVTLGAHDDTVSHGAHDDTVIDGYAAQLTVAQFRDEYDAVLEAMLEHDHADDPEGTTSLPEMCMLCNCRQIRTSCGEQDAFNETLYEGPDIHDVCTCSYGWP